MGFHFLYFFRTPQIEIKLREGIYYLWSSDIILYISHSLTLNYTKLITGVDLFMLYNQINFHH